LLWGYAYERPASSGTPGEGLPPDYVQARDEKQYRLSRIGLEGSIFGLSRKSVLARDIRNNGEPSSYFKVYASIYKCH
jgi:hypothetical protein